MLSDVTILQTQYLVAVTGILLMMAKALHDSEARPHPLLDVVGMKHLSHVQGHGSLRKGQTLEGWEILTWVLRKVSL